MVDVLAVILDVVFKLFWILEAFLLVVAIYLYAKNEKVELDISKQEAENIKFEKEFLKAQIIRKIRINEKSRFYDPEYNNNLTALLQELEGDHGERR